MWNNIEVYLPLCRQNAGQWIGQHVMPIELVVRRLVELNEMPCLYRNCTSHWIIEWSRTAENKIAKNSFSLTNIAPHKNIVADIRIYVWFLLLPQTMMMIMMSSLIHILCKMTTACSATYRSKWNSQCKRYKMCKIKQMLHLICLNVKFYYYFLLFSFEINE